MQQAPIPTENEMRISPGILGQSRHFYFAEISLSDILLNANDHFKEHIFSHHALAGPGAAFSTFIYPEEINRYKEALRQCLYAPAAITLRMKYKAGEERRVCWELQVAEDDTDLVYAIGYDEPGSQVANEIAEQAVQRQKQITQATIDAQERERLLLGKELHDNISQHLTTTRLFLEVAKEKTEGEVEQMLTRSHASLVNIIHELKSLSHALVPASLGDIGLAESLYDLADTMKQVQGLSASICCQHFSEEDLPANMKLMLFRVIQEHLQDAARHFSATVAEIRLQADREAITLIITDNRKNPEAGKTVAGPVFENITNRVSLFNGHAEETNMPGGGCILTVHIPVPPSGSPDN